MKHLISLNGDGNTITFIRGNDGDICITFSIPDKKIFNECVRIGTGNSGGQVVPIEIKRALINVCNEFEKWENQ